MTDYRRGFVKTAWSAGLIALAGFGAIVSLDIKELMPSHEASLLIILLWGMAGFLLLCGETVSILVLTGAIISLHRDTLEDRGLPYGAYPREWHGGFFVRNGRAFLRRLRALGGLRPGQLDLRSGELVEVRSLDEILATLDSRGERDSLPFMPEMEAWCGKQARVFRRVDKIFDWIHSSGLKKMNDTVILESLRCNGCHHGGCQGDCPLLWKEIWLRRASPKVKSPAAQVTTPSTRPDLRQFTTRIDEPTGEQRWVCQLSRLPEATTPTSWNNPLSNLKELLRGNVRIGPFLIFLSIILFNSVQRRFGLERFPYRAPSQRQSTPHVVLNLQPGELVQVKSKREIEETLDSKFKNRGLWFDKEMTRFCGGKYTVLARVSCQIDERTGKMMKFTNPCIALDGVTATGEYHEFAPLDERIFWREIWLKRTTNEPPKNELS